MSSNTFITATMLTVTATVIVLAGSAKAATYYVSSHIGNDAHDGLSAETAWQSLDKVNSVLFEPGDSLLLASDSVFKGQLAPKGSGAMQNGKWVPIVIDRFGEGALPRIDGEGKVNAPLFLHNVEGWEIQNIELTNTGETRKENRYGLLILIDGEMMTGRHFVIRNVTVQKVNGIFSKVWDNNHVPAGIRINAFYKRDELKSDQLGRRLENVLIEDCTVRDCERNGIVVSGNKDRRRWNPNTGIVVRRNLIERVNGNGILVVGCEGALAEWNIMRDCSDLGLEIDAAAGMWPIDSDNSVFQFNEVDGHKASVDGQAYDCDYNCNNTLFQYNLSRNNRGGFMLICSPGENVPYDGRNRGPTVRYNLSINDGSRKLSFRKNHHYRSPLFYLTGGSTTNSEIYGNVLIIPKKPDPKMDTNFFDFNNWGGKYPVNTKVRDNVFVLLDGQPGTFSFAQAKQVLFENNYFYGDVKEIVETEEIKSVGNQYMKKTPRKVVITGSEAELNTFAEFLQKKGNPQEDAGITIDWQVK